MHYATLLVTALLLILSGCGEEQAGSSGEEAGEQTEVTREVTQEVTREVTQEVAGMSQEEADALKAQAASEEITLEELRNIDDSTAYGEQLVLGLGSCQLVKYAAENGQAAADEFAANFVDQVAQTPEGKEVTSIQEALIMEGYSCTTQEAMSYATGVEE